MTRALLCLLMLGSCASAAEEPACSTRSDVLAHLSSRYREVPIALGLSNQGYVVELLVSPSGTWTLIRTDSTGRTCLTDAGEHFQTRGESS